MLTPTRRRYPSARCALPEDNWATLRAEPTDRRQAIGFECIGRVVRRMRLSAGLSQRQLAGLVGVNQSTISRLECGRLRYLRFQRLAEVFGILDDPLLGRSLRLTRWS